MNLDFGILWIEDSYSAEEEANLRRRVADAGFIARIEVLEDGAGLEECARRHRLYHDYDLVLLDYHLRNEAFGNELAPRIRELFPSTSILFYSGSAPEQELRTMIAERQVEGVYCCARSRFIERTGSLIDQTARALDRLSGMRGLAMRVVAECDALMKDAIFSMSSRHQKCAEKLGELDQDVLSFIRDAKAAYEESVRGSLEDRIATRAIDSAKLYKHFRRLTQVAAADSAVFGLNDEQVDRLRALRKSSVDYDKAVLRVRNILGHVMEVRSAEGWVVKGSNEISAKDFPSLRREFARHIGAVREICQLVRLLDTNEVS